jgi:hypothetical protein
MDTHDMAKGFVLGCITTLLVFVIFISTSEYKVNKVIVTPDGRKGIVTFSSWSVVTKCEGGGTKDFEYIGNDLKEYKK